MVERRQQQPLQLALSMKEQPAGVLGDVQSPGGGALAKSRPMATPQEALPAEDAVKTGATVRLFGFVVWSPRRSCADKVR